MLLLPRRSAPQIRQAITTCPSAGSVRTLATGRARPSAPSSVKLTSDRVRPAIASGSGLLSSSSTRPAPSSSTVRLISFASRRHNSTATPSAPSQDPFSSPPPPPSPPSDPDAPPSASPSEPRLPPAEYSSYEQALEALTAFSTVSPPPTAEQYEQLIKTLTYRGPSKSPDEVPLVETAYQQMLDQSVVPTDETLAFMIHFLCRRDARMPYHMTIKGIKPEYKGRVGMSDKPVAAFQSAVALFRASVSPTGDRPAVTFSTLVYDRLLAAAVRHKDAQTAREIFLDLDARSEAPPAEGVTPPKVSYAAFNSLVQAFSYANAPAVRVAFDAFRAKDQAGKMAEVEDEATRASRRTAVWTTAIKAFVRLEDAESAKALFAEGMAAPRPARAPSSERQDLEADSSTPASVNMVSQPSAESSVIPPLDGAKLSRELFGSSAQSKSERQILHSLLKAALPALAGMSVQEVQTFFRQAIEAEAADRSAAGICAVLRMLQGHDPDVQKPAYNAGLLVLFSLPRLDRSQFAYGHELARARVEGGGDIPWQAGGAIVERLAEPLTSQGATVEEIGSFHRQALSCQGHHGNRVAYHKRVVSALLQRPLSSPARQVQVLVALTVALKDLTVALDDRSYYLAPIPEHVGALKDIYTRARAELGGDISRLGLTSESIAVLLDALAAADEAVGVPTRHGRVIRPKSRRPEMSLVESFVTDLVVIGDGLGEINIRHSKTRRAFKILCETMARAEAKLMLAPFIEESSYETAEEEPELDESRLPETAVEAEEPAGESETSETSEVTKLSQPAFDFANAPWRSLVSDSQAEGLVALVPKPEPEDSPPTEPEADVVEEEPVPAPEQPVAEEAPVADEDSINSLFFDPPTVDRPPPTSEETPSSLQVTNKPARRERPKKSQRKRSAQLLDARLSSLLQTHDGSTALASYQCLRETLVAGHIPRPWLISRVGEALGRQAEHHKVIEVVRLLEHLSDGGKAWSWEQTRMIHSDVIAAFAYCRDTVSTEFHKAYLYDEMGAKPNAQAYGALIFNGADATGDASYAVRLWKEAREGNQVLHRHLFNGLIKAFGNVGKVDEAVQLLEQMRATKGRATPSWASYGFAIEACLQSGQLEHAKELYAQMQTETLATPRRNFKPSILPYTSMMQHYATREKDRDALVRVDGDLRELDLLPHSFTYEVLINAYGSISPVDKDTMWDVLELLEANQTQHAQIQGFHWAAVIRSLGIDDFDAALATFELIEARPSSVNKNPPLPDVVCYEAILEVAAKESRQDVIDKIVKQMESSLMASTAKAHLLIKTYGQAKNLESARKVFESTIDEPVDLVRPLRKDPSSPIPGPTAPIYRDATIWEAMIRLESSEGNSAEAVQLLERMIEFEWKPTLRPIATIRSLGELLEYETHEDGEEVEFSFERDVEQVRTITLEERAEIEEREQEEKVEEAEESKVDGASEVEDSEGKGEETSEKEVEAPNEVEESKTNP